MIYILIPIIVLCATIFILIFIVVVTLFRIIVFLKIDKDAKELNSILFSIIKSMWKFKIK